MVASREVEIPYYRGVGRQRGRELAALEKVIRRTAFAILRKYVVPAAERMGADLWAIAVPEIADAVSGRKKFKTAAKGKGRQTLRKQLGSGSRKKSARKLITTKPENKPVSREETFLQTFLIKHVEYFAVPAFVAVS